MCFGEGIEGCLLPQISQHSVMESRGVYVLEHELGGYTNEKLFWSDTTSHVILSKSFKLPEAYWYYM